MPNLRVKLVVGETERWINHIYYEYFRPVLTDRDREIDGQTLASSTTFGEPKKEESWEERFEAGFLELDLKDTQPSVFNYDTCVRPKEEQGATLYTVIVGGLFDIEMDSSENDEFFLEWIAKGRMEHGYFQIFRPHEDQIIWLEFWDGFCVSYQEHMSKGNRPPVMKLRISPAITRNRKTVVQQENWKISDIDMKWKRTHAPLVTPLLKKLHYEANGKETEVLTQATADLVVTTEDCKGRKIPIEFSYESHFGAEKFTETYEITRDTQSIKIEFNSIDNDLYVYKGDGSKKRISLDEHFTGLKASATVKSDNRKAELTLARITKGYWTDENGTELKRKSSDGFNTDLFYGEKTKLKIKTVGIQDGEKLKLVVKAEKGRNKITFPDSELEVTVNGGEAVSEPFFLKPEWYAEHDEIEEKYDYGTYETSIRDAYKTLTFIFDVKTESGDALRKGLPVIAANKIRPSTYRRNYEEMIGLFEENGGGTKHWETNYENKFIKGNPQIETIVEDFITEVTKEGLTVPDIETLVEDKAKALWDSAVAQVQTGKLDDRPLYWARNKMQTWLKRNPLFKNDTKSNSCVKKGTELDRIITIFEEKSRNYTGIDFSNAKVDPKKVEEAKKKLTEAKAKVEARDKLYKTQKEDLEKKLAEAQKTKDASKIQAAQTAVTDLEKVYLTEVNLLKKDVGDAEVALKRAEKPLKVLITGFDPFILNEFDNTALKPYNPNILQSNPSGCVALALSDSLGLGACIQTMMIPVRYQDFDSSSDRNKGSGIGIIEKYIGKWINKVDMIMTISQANFGDYHIDVFATATRGGGIDNMNFIRQSNSKLLKNILNETLVTKLPVTSIQPPSVATYYGEYYENALFNSKRNSSVKNYPKTPVFDGPGGNYLSNEIFYRVARLREIGNSSLPTGHFHISKLQNIGDKFINNDMQLSLDKIKTAISQAIKGL